MITKATRSRLNDWDFVRDFRYRKYRRPERSSGRARFLLLATFILLIALALGV